MNRAHWTSLKGLVFVCAFAVAAASAFAGFPAPQTRQASTPVLEVDPFWPTMPDKILFGPVRGISIDSQDHVWIAQDPSALTADMLGAASDPPTADCCRQGPPVMEFDAAGKYVGGWGGAAAAGETYEWPQQIHGIFVDYKNNVWVSSERQGDNHVLKFTRAGKFLMQIGRRGQSKGSNDTENVNRAADMYVHPKTNELFVADGYGNRRVIVFDAETGAYKRHWGAYGNKPDDTVAAGRGARASNAPQFNLVHSVRVSTDDMVYVADRNNNRLQVFTLDGKFVKETFVAKETATTNGTVYSIAFSIDPQQQFLYVADAANGHIRILNRQSLEVLASIGRWGRQPGQFMVPHSIATDSKGNLYVADIREGRLQKFALKK